jgi:hypothetical protein
MKTIEKWRIEQWDGNTGNLINTHPSIQYTAHTLGMSPRTIRESIKSGNSDYRGYYWKKKYE